MRKTFQKRNIKRRSGKYGEKEIEKKAKKVSDSLIEC